MTDLRTGLERLLQRETVPGEGTLPIERLAGGLAALGEATSALGEQVALLADGLTGGLLYRTHPERVLACLEGAVARLGAEERRRLLAAFIEMRPIESATLGRYLRLSLDALGLDGRDPHALCAAWPVELHRTVYRWSDAMRHATAHQMGEIASLFAERRITGDGGHPWDVFQSLVGYQPTVILTPRQSPAVRAELESMQRHDWLDMPWMFGGPDATFCIDEIEEDSSPQNMADGGRIAHSLLLQRTPFTDFFGKSFAWHPRQTIERVIEIAAQHGFDRIEAATTDRFPRRLERHELDDAARETRAHAVRAMSGIDPSALPVEVGLSFYEGEEGTRAVLELQVASTFGGDGKKYAVQIALGDPDAILSALREHARLLSPAGLPLLLARLYALTPDLRVHVPDGPFVRVDAARAELWDRSAPREPRHPVHPAAAAPSPFPAALLGAWRGQVTPDDYEAYQPFAIELVPDPRGARGMADTPFLGAVEMVGVFAGGRLSLRQDDPHAQLLADMAWDEEARTLQGRFRLGGMGGPIRLEKQGAPRDATAEELLAELGTWSSHLRLDLEALRFPGESELLRALFADPHFRASYLESAANRAARTDAKQLDAFVGRGATLLTRAMLPSAFRALDAAREALGLSDDVQLWVHNDFTLNAFVTVDGSTIACHFTSGFLEVLTEVELEAAIGHELGHVLFGSHALAIRLTDTRMSGQEQRRYLALRRHQELSADRMSLVACADPRAVFVVQTMLRTGIRRRDLFGGVDALVENARVEVEKLRTRPRGGLHLASHPYSSLRTVALDLFARSSAFRALRPDAAVPGGPLDDADLAGELAALRDMLDVPEATVTRADATGDVARFLALCALRLVEADQSITIRELAALSRLDPAMGAELNEVVGWTHERRDVEILDRARSVNRALPTPDRERLLGELVRVVRTDNVVQYVETSLVGEIGALLQIDTHAFRKTMEELYRSSR